MHDIKAIRENSAAFDKNWARRGLPAQTPTILKLDEKVRAVKTELQKLQSERNDKSGQIGKIKKEGGNADAIMADVAAIKDKMTALEAEEKQIGDELTSFLSGLPNMLADDVPDGKDEHSNKQVRSHGEPKKTNAGIDHAEIG